MKFYRGGDFNPCFNWQTLVETLKAEEERGNEDTRIQVAKKLTGHENTSWEDLYDIVQKLNLLSLWVTPYENIAKLYGEVKTTDIYTYGVLANDGDSGYLVCITTKQVSPQWKCYEK